jgi:hypothetical protein
LSAARDGDCAAWFIEDVADRVANRIQSTSDGHKALSKMVIDWLEIVEAMDADTPARKRGPH